MRRSCTFVSLLLFVQRFDSISFRFVSFCFVLHLPLHTFVRTKSLKLFVAAFWSANAHFIEINSVPTSSCWRSQWVVALTVALLVALAASCFVAAFS